MQKQVQVACGLVFNGGSLLQLKRAAGNPYADTWCVPGGKFEVEHDVTLVDTVEREVHEETGICVKAVTLLGSCTVGEYVFSYYLCVLRNVVPSVVLRAAEHSAYRWSKIGTAFLDDSSPADICFFTQDVVLPAKLG